MASVKITYHLRQFFPDLAPTDVEGVTVAEVVAALERHYAGIATYITDEHGALRRHVNIFVDGSLITVGRRSPMAFRIAVRYTSCRRFRAVEITREERLCPIQLQQIRKGLPQDYCYDLTFRHALALSGDRLAFGPTTGNAYFSDDRGESWQALSHTLPPIYSVRFA